MAGTFNWMRANDLIWSYVVSNWYMGKKPPAFDILTWNADATRMPAAMHSQYLRSCYLHNLLVVPNAFVLDDVPLDIGKVTTPLYVLGAEADHIAPWRTSFATSQYVGGPVKYTRTNSGHVAGICNPPGNPKSCSLDDATPSSRVKIPTRGSRAAPNTREAGGKIGRHGPTRTAALAAHPIRCRTAANRHRAGTFGTKRANQSISLHLNHTRPPLV